MDQDNTFMNQAIDLTRQAIGRTAPNPSVGAVIVKDHNIVGKGFHPKAGKPHAEIYAIEEAGDKAKGSCLYVTLEPCNHHGKTPPCTEAIIQAGVSRVVIGTLDPNPIVSGKGALRLEEAGIKVDVGVCAQECSELIAWYAFWIKTGRPYVILKAAMTLDGRIAATTGDSKWISSEESRNYVHRLRNEVDGVIIGVGTAAKDDPQLTCRISEGRDPVRIILDTQFTISKHMKCLGPSSLLFTTRSPDLRPEITDQGTKVVQIKPDSEGMLSWDDILMHLGKMGFHAVMVEGGSGIYSSILKSGVVDKLIFFIAPKILGGGLPLIDWGRTEKIADALKINLDKVYLMGGDILVEGSLEG